MTTQDLHEQNAENTFRKKEEEHANGRISRKELRQTFKDF